MQPGRPQRSDLRPTNAAPIRTSEVEAADYFEAIARHRVLGGAVFTIVVLAGLLLALFGPTEYGATSRVLLRTKDSQLLFPVAVASDSDALLRVPTVEVEYVASDAFQRRLPTLDDGVEISVTSNDEEDSNELRFRAVAPSPGAAVDTANEWAHEYVEARHAIAVREAATAKASVDRSIEQLEDERRSLLAEVALLDSAIAEAAGSDDFSRLVSQRVLLLQILAPALDPIETQLEILQEREIALAADLEALADPGVSAVVSRSAELPADRVSSSPARTVALSILVGAFLAFASALLASTMRERAGTEREITQAADLPILARVPKRQGFKHRFNSGPQLLGDETEPFESLVTSLDPAMLGDDYRTLLFSSPRAGEGKSTTISNLAAVLGRNKRVVLVDADLRRPALHEVFGVPRSPGLTDVLSGSSSVEESTRRVSVGGAEFDVIPAGAPVASPVALLRSEAATELLAGLARANDRVLIDSPPLLDLTDGQVLAHYCDGIVVVVDTTKTKTSELASAVRRLRTGYNGHVLGVVMNKFGKSTPYG